MKKAFVKTLTEIWLPKEDVKQADFQILCFPDAHEILVQACINAENGWLIQLGEKLELGKKYELKADDQIYPVSFRLFTATSDFEGSIHVEKERLGANCLGNSTYFAIWAPTAYQVDLLFLHQGNTQERWAMERSEQGVWRKGFDSNLHGTAYVYEICVDGESYQVVDPYTRSATVNAEAGVVVDLEKITPVPRISLPPLQNQEKIIYEMNIRDYTISSTSEVVRKGKYVGFTDEEPLCYLQQLGVTYIQLMPLQKFFGVDERNPLHTYNWGYNPLLYFVPEGSYSTNPENPFERILEVKELVYRLHRKQIRVILDVVYNHVYHIETHAFDRIVPGYYIRTHPDGTYIDSCGCGNDLATERKMVRKLIVESLIYWLETFDVDGFRFDLMGNMDIDTMREIQKYLTSRKQDLLLLGEGWDLPTTLPHAKKAVIANAGQLPDYAFFHDVFRDGVKGSIFDLRGRGFGTGAKNQGQWALQLFVGCDQAFGASVQLDSFQQSINYIECHDNHTLFDKISLCCTKESLAQKKDRQKMMTAFTLLAQGIPFLQCGQEFFRSKKGEANTYNLCDKYNEIDWSLVRTHQTDIQWIASVIQLRKSHGVFGFRNSQSLQAYGQVEALWADGFAYHWNHVGHLGAADEIFIAFHFGSEEQELDLSAWQDAEILLRMNVDVPQEAHILSCEKIHLHPLSLLVAARK